MKITVRLEAEEVEEAIARYARTVKRMGGQVCNVRAEYSYGTKDRPREMSVSFELLTEEEAEAKALLQRIAEDDNV